MKTAQISLQKRLHSDTIFTYIISGVLAAASVVRLINFFIALDNVRLAGAEYTGSVPKDLLSDALLFMFLAAAMFLLSLVLREIHSTGKPFSKKNVDRFRAMAYVLIFASIIPEAAKGLVDFVDSDAAYGVFQLFSADNLCIMLFGVVCGLISEVFKYGYEFQDNMDSIA